MDKITAFIMTHPDVTIEIKKDANFYQSINIKIRKNNSTYRKTIDENKLTELESILSYMYDVVSNKQVIEAPTCSECEHYEDHHTSLACANCPVRTRVWGGAE